MTVVAEPQAPAYTHLLSPLQVGAVTLPNRVIMGSMHLGLEEEPDGFERMAAFYAERARGEVGLIVTGGISPNHAGRPVDHGAVLATDDHVARHRLITDAVHAEGGLIVVQLLHFGRYAKHADLVAPSAIMAPINRLLPRALSSAEAEQTVEDFAQAAELAMDAGYDGVEIMGSEGYLINEFTAAHTNQRDDEWGGDAERRMRFPIEIVTRTRERIGDDPLVLYRLSVLDLVPDGANLDETIRLARQIEGAGASLINTGIGWHESRVPTIATMVPRAAFADATRKVMDAVGIPVAVSNRVNDPEVAERLLADGTADLVSMARPLLADPAFVQKARQGRADRINTCIACNQACIDHTLAGKLTSCLVNPRAARETILLGIPARHSRQVAVVGAGPAGLAAATSAARRGHMVTLFEAAPVLGGQFDVARRIPGKEEFAQTLRYFRTELDELGVDVRLSTWVRAVDLQSGWDEVVVATGIAPRLPEIEGIDHPSVVGYLDVLRGDVVPGDDVVIIGAGGIGFDVATFLTHAPNESAEEFFEQWGVDPLFAAPGALVRPVISAPPRHVTLLQRKASKLGAGLGLTTGWIHRAELAQKQVRMVAGADYRRIDDEGLHITVDGVDGTIAASTIVICAGQEPNRTLADELAALGVTAHIVGGARVASELDAKRAIREAIELAEVL
jgi:2,4-dienoyl-CoA reductase (NADPH2)